jgi:histidinol-phosphatase (PHP family)
MKLFDYHTHNEISFDSEATLLGHCEWAVKKGLAEIALTNHHELDMVLLGTAEAPDLEKEEALLLEAKEVYAGRLDVLRGIEVGQPSYDREAFRKLVTARDYDIVLGSQHNGKGNIDFYFMDCKSMSDDYLRELWDAYLEDLLSIAKTAEVDVLTHILYPVRYVEKERRHCFPVTRDAFEPVFKALIERGIALEINTAAVRRGVLATPDPCLDLLTFYRELGGEYLTLGSDAHISPDVGAHVKEAAALAEQAGFRYLTRFRQRNKIMEAIR